jgi:hypothetical protein
VTLISVPATVHDLEPVHLNLHTALSVIFILILSSHFSLTPMDLREIDWEGIEWIQMAQDRDWWRAAVNTVMNLRVLVPRS